MSLEFHVAGFGAYCGVSSNPSQKVVEDVKRGDVKSTFIFHEVTQKACDRFLVEAFPRSNNSNVKPVVLVLVSLDPALKTPHLVVEPTAVNEFQGLCVTLPAKSTTPVDARHKLSDVQLTAIDCGALEKTVTSVRERRGRPPAFIANYLYYQALSRSVSESKSAVDVLLVHVPPVSVMAVADQSQTMGQLLDALVSTKMEATGSRDQLKAVVDRRTKYAKAIVGACEEECQLLTSSIAKKLERPTRADLGYVRPPGVEFRCGTCRHFTRAQDVEDLGKCQLLRADQSTVHQLACCNMWVNAKSSEHEARYPSSNIVYARLGWTIVSQE